MLDNILINNTTIDLATDGLNGIAGPSNNLSGTVYPNSESTSLIGISTIFTSDLISGDIINISNQSRKVISIINNTTLNIDTPFSVLNIWTLNGAATLSTTAFKFGTKSLAASTAVSYGNVIDGYYNGFDATVATWTLEFFFRLSAINANLAICSSNTANTLTLTFATASKLLNISLGQGTTMNIANATAVTGTLVANTWYHVAIVFNGTTYKVYLNGILGSTITSSLKITSTAFNNFRFGSNGTTTFNGYIDEIRLSNNERYTTTFTPTTIPFVKDVNTIWLNHFENTTITNSDDTTQNVYLNYTRGGSYYNNTFLYTYALNHSTTPGYILSTRSSLSTLVDLPTNYYTTDAIQIPFYIPIQSNGTPYNVFQYQDIYFELLPNPVLCNNLSNTTASAISVANYVPYNCNKIRVLITHSHIGTISCGITIGPTSALYKTVLTTNVTSHLSLSTNIIITNNFTFDAFLSLLASTTSYFIYLEGFYINN